MTGRRLPGEKLNNVRLDRPTRESLIWRIVQDDINITEALRRLVADGDVIQKARAEGHRIYIERDGQDAIELHLGY